MRTSKRVSLQPDAMILLAEVLNCFKDINLFFKKMRSKGEVIAGDVKVEIFFLFSINIAFKTWTIVFLPSDPMIANIFPRRS